MEDEMSCEEQCVWPNFAPLGNPLAMQVYSELGPWRQDWRAELVRVRDDPTRDAVLLVTLKVARKVEKERSELKSDKEMKSFTNLTARIAFF